MSGEIARISHEFRMYSMSWFVSFPSLSGKDTMRIRLISLVSEIMSNSTATAAIALARLRLALKRKLFKVPIRYCADRV